MVIKGDCRALVEVYAPPNPLVVFLVISRDRMCIHVGKVDKIAHNCVIPGSMVAGNDGRLLLYPRIIAIKLQQKL